MYLLDTAPGLLFYKTHFLQVADYILFIVNHHCSCVVKSKSGCLLHGEGQTQLTPLHALTGVRGKQCRRTGGQVRAGFGQIVHAGVSGCVEFGLKSLRVGSGCNFQAR